MVRRSPLAGLGRGIRRGIGRGMWLSRPGASQVQSHAEAKRLRRADRNIRLDIRGRAITESELQIVAANAAVIHGGTKVKITKAVQLAMDPTDPDWQRRR